MKTLNIPIAAALKERLDSYSIANGIHKKKVVELALEAYLKKTASPAATDADAGMPFDDHPVLRK